MTSRSVIVFGPTGAVGSAAARVAHQHGAKVTLAMRDTAKCIPGLNPSQEAADGYQRVRADLSQPDTVRSAVIQTGAKHAFIYMVFGSSDHMRASIEALKDAGIESVVLLSSISVQGDPHEVSPNDLIAFAHAQAEINLLEVFGKERFTAVRPAFFASNSFWWSRQIATEAEVKTSFPDVRLDYISPEDIGAVCGTLLAGAAHTAAGDQEINFVKLVGPEILSVAEAIQVIARVLGKDVGVTTVNDDECLQIMVTKSELPEPLAKHLIDQFAQLRDGAGFFGSTDLEEYRTNIERYLQRPPTKFEQWVEQHKENFSS
ncbi:hypothetical protein BDV59DRAFT_124554 [Aspergillus ambiguus]|uniref:NmrA-like family protein n=1 Tax=Aspergillus ambiguus TaxID=176160 RepID=UPI003CCD8A4E